MTINLTELERLAKAAMPGKREWSEPDYDAENKPPKHCASYALHVGDESILSGCENCGNIFYSKGDGDFIAALDPQTVLALIRCASAAVRWGQWDIGTRDQIVPMARPVRELHDAARDFEL